MKISTRSEFSSGLLYMELIVPELLVVHEFLFLFCLVTACVVFLDKHMTERQYLLAAGYRLCLHR